MRTIELNNQYDIFVQNGNLAVQRDNLSVIRQTIVNTLSLIKGEDVYDSTHGLNLSIIFGDDVSFADKVAEIKRVIMLEPSVVSVDNIKMEADPRTRVGYFTCYITVTVEGESVQTTINFGV
jgi:hypothetical protein